MTIVTKTINGIQYLYYQDAENGKIVTTEIGRADLAGDKMLEVRFSTLMKHLSKLLIERGIKTSPYHFEHEPTATIFKDVNAFETIRAGYQAIKTNIRDDELEDLERILFVKYVHGTTAIEGNTFTEEETAKLLFEELTTENKTVDETLEIANYRDVKRFLQTDRGDVTESLIKGVHRLLMKGIKGRNRRPIKAGEYRRTPVTVGGMELTPPPPESVPEHMRLMLREYHDNIEKRIHPMEVASIFHLSLEQIHPFEDGNGRVGREILNYMLAQNGYPLIYVTPKQRSQYLKALEEGDKGNITAILDFVLDRVTATMLYLQTRTHIFDEIKSDEYRKVFVDMAGEEAYNTYIGLLTAQKNAGELP